MSVEKEASLDVIVQQRDFMRRVREALKPVSVGVSLGEDCRGESIERAFHVTLGEAGRVEDVVPRLGEFLRREYRGDAFVVDRFIFLDGS